MNTNQSVGVLPVPTIDVGSEPDSASDIHVAFTRAFVRAVRRILADYLCISTAKHAYFPAPDSAMSSIAAATALNFHRDQPTQGSMISIHVLFLAALVAFCIYSTIQFFRRLVSLYGHLQRARAIGLPMKVIPFPPGLFSFFVFQILRRLGLLKPGTKLHRLLSMGRPDGYDLHKEMGDVFVTVSPTGLTLIVADPKVATYVNSKRTEFPKPPNTGGE